MSILVGIFRLCPCNTESNTEHKTGREFEQSAEDLYFLSD